MSNVHTAGSGLGQALRIVAFAGLIAAWTVPGRGLAAEDAGAFLADLNTRAIEQLTDPAASEDEKQRRFRVLMNAGFDIEAIGRFVLGRYWRGAGPADRNAFLSAFEDMMVFRFLPLFEDYSKDKLRVGAVRPFGGGEDTFNVSSELLRKEGEPVRVDWRVRQHGGQYKILDVIAEGVSVAVTLRSEYGSVLKQNGGSVTELTRALREKVATL